MIYIEAFHESFFGVYIAKISWGSWRKSPRAGKPALFHKVDDSTGAFGFQLEKWKLHRCLTHLQVFVGTRPKTIAIVRTSLRDAMLLETFAFVAIRSLVIGWS
jgi:hypothetical protein